MGGGSHIEMAKKLVIQTDKALSMECQLVKRVLRGGGGQPLSPKGDKKPSQEREILSPDK